MCCLSGADIMVKNVLPCISVLLLCCCGGKTDSLPSSKGGASELLLVVDKAVWQSDLADSLERVAKGDVPGLMQHEDYYRTVRVFSEHLKRRYATMHSKLYVRLNAKLKTPRMGVAHNVCAAPQIEVLVEAPDITSLRRFLSAHTGDIRDTIDEFQLGMRTAGLRRRHCRKAMEGLRSHLGFSLYTPVGIVASKCGKDFYWMGSNLNEKDQNVVVYTFPWVGAGMPSMDVCLQKRDSVMKDNIPGSRPGQWMETVRNDSVPIAEDRLRRTAAGEVREIRGLWQMRNGALGGPFVSMARLDTAADRVVVTEGFVYSPGTDKRELVRELEAALRTLYKAE